MRFDLYRKITVLFWTIWWLIAFFTDFFGGLYQLKLVNFQWAYASKNYPGLVKALAMFHLPAWVPGVLYVGIIAWLLVIAIVFCVASVLVLLHKENAHCYVCAAFIISLFFWMVLFLADQLTLKFSLAENHMVQGGFQLLTWMSMYLLPNFKQKA